MVRHLGTAIPLVLVAMFAVLAAAILANGYSPDWLRASVYLFGFLATLLGTYACIKIATSSGREGWSVFILTLIYRELALLPIFFVLLNSILGVFDTPDWFGLAMLAVSTLAIGLSNGVLFLSLRYNILEQEVDWLPFRALFRREKP